jgi:hypothetical protein
MPTTSVGASPTIAQQENIGQVASNKPNSIFCWKTHPKEEDLCFLTFIRATFPGYSLVVNGAQFSVYPVNLKKNKSK